MPRTPDDATTIKPTPVVDMEFTTALTPLVSSTQRYGCTQNGLFYADGSAIETEDPCEHCYCIQGKAVCAVESCMGEGPLEGDSDHCDPQPPALGECCPTEYKCGKPTLNII